MQAPNDDDALPLLCPNRSAMIDPSAACRVYACDSTCTKLQYSTSRPLVTFQLCVTKFVCMQAQQSRIELQSLAANASLNGGKTYTRQGNPCKLQSNAISNDAGTKEPSTAAVAAAVAAAAAATAAAATATATDATVE